MTAYSSVESAGEAMKAGAYDYLANPLDFDEFKITIDRAMAHTRLKDENRHLKFQLKDLAVSRNIIGTSPLMQQLL